MSKEFSQGIIEYSERSPRPTDYLYRISLKALIRDVQGKVLVVKESGRDWWDLPGGGMDHGESIESALARELKEEVELEGDFEWHVITVDEPKYLEVHDFWQLRLIVSVQPSKLVFAAGVDSDEVTFIDPNALKDSLKKQEQEVYRYSCIASPN